jgi:hypothetical protein
MALKVTYKSPPYRDKALDFDDSIQTIRFGRTAGSEVAFPEEMAIVGHDHFALRREAGAYKFVINPHHRVYLYGKDVFDGQELSGANEIRLGTKEGPRLLLEPQTAHAAGYVSTEPQGRSATERDVARSNARWTHMLGGAVALLLLIGLFAYWQLSDSIQPIYANAGSGTDFSAIIAKYQKSVFLVDEVDAGGGSRGGATAWVVQMPDGSKAFATNAHVGEILADARKKGFRLVVRSPVAPYTEFEIKDALIHPAYAAFNAMVDDANKKASTGALREVQLSPAYDVALLIPARQDGIPDALPLAKDVTLRALHAGQPVAFIGYPAENLVAFDTNAPTPTSQVGIITSLRTFFLTNDGGPTQLIEDSLPSAGGASGSPIFDANGNVVALLSGGNNITSKNGRIPNAALVNFAQRVDLLVELMDGRAAASLGDNKRMWADAVSRWSRPPEAIAALYAKSFEETEGKLTSFSKDGQTGAPDALFDKRSAQTYDFDLKADTRYLVTAYTPSKKPIRVVVYNADDPGSLLDTTVYVADGPLTVLEVPAGTPGKVKIAVISEATSGGSPDTGPIPFKLNVYWSTSKPTQGSGQETGASRTGHAPPATPAPGQPPANPDQPPEQPATPAHPTHPPANGGAEGGDVGQGPNQSTH